MTTTTATYADSTHDHGARASGARMGSGGTLPKAGASPLRNSNAQLLQTVLFWAGAIMMPLGIVIILLGYYGVANSVYDFEREAYQVSGGFLGLGITFLGGFLYFGAWLARIGADNREASKRLADTLLVLADVVSRSAAINDDGVDTNAIPVTAGDGTTMHRRDCALIAHRDDLQPAGARTDLTACRVCKP
ncbi:hypothetical protein [Nocardioides sp. R-C-SC26]|uniref:hypothetical protein n=1 Tax=Nocardioides sp. R-C-SC26 TaxID=2870414 RepID=UPI001E59649F|nr:hypothetical protein [Nocardioides sp. R-C-SC26]